jgi:hypothetical protein
MERQPKAKMPHNAKLMFEVELEHIDWSSASDLKTAMIKLSLET